MTIEQISEYMHLVLGYILGSTVTFTIIKLRQYIGIRNIRRELDELYDSYPEEVIK